MFRRWHLWLENGTYGFTYTECGVFQPKCWWKCKIIGSCLIFVIFYPQAKFSAHFSPHKMYNFCHQNIFFSHENIQFFHIDIRLLKYQKFTRRWWCWLRWWWWWYWLSWWWYIYNDEVSVCHVFAYFIFSLF